MEANHSHITVAFSYPISTYDGMETNPALVQATVTDSVHKLCDETMKKFNCQIHISSPESLFTQSGLHEFNFAILMTGLPNQVIDAKGALLRKNPSQSISTIKVNKLYILNDNGEMKNSVRKKLDEIMNVTKTQITCVGQYDKMKPPPGLAPDSMDMEIMGKVDAVEHARLRCLVFLDQLSGLYSEAIHLDARLLPIVAGRKSIVVNTIMRETLTNIYVPSVFRVETLVVPQLEDPSWDSDPAHRVTIYITGHKSSVLAAKDKLTGIMAAKKSMLLSRTVICLSRKLDWILVNKKDKIYKIMSDNATLVVMPPLGTNTNMLTVLGDDRVYIERTLRAMMLLVCHFYVSCAQRPPGAPLVAPIPQRQVYPSFSSPAVDSTPIHIHGHIQQLCRATRAEIILQPQYIEICGHESSVKAAFEQIIATDFLKNSRDAKFQLELALEHREFINGKKNGKINKIIKISGCKINFQENFNGYNMLIEIQNSSAVHALEGLTLLEDEMPAEISFFVPEAYHKRIIGVGGKNIQRIMKKYGVYVKFSNAEEFASLGGYFENEDNVIARTPAKNAINLDQLKESIAELVTTKEKRDVDVIVNIPREHHRTVLGVQGINLQRIEATTGIKITFPTKESGSDEVVLQGGEAEVQHAKQMLKELVPELCEIQVPASGKVKTLVESQEFTQEVIFKSKKEFMIDVYVVSPFIFSSVSAGENNGFPLNADGHPMNYSLVLHYYPTSKLDAAKAMIFKYLASKEIPLEPDALTRTASFAASNAAARTTTYDSFQHFNSKLLAPVTTGVSSETRFILAESPKAVVSSSYSLFDGGSRNAFDLAGERGPKVTHSAPNLRLLFEDVVFPASTAPLVTTGASTSMSKLNNNGYQSFNKKARSEVFDDDQDAVDSLDILGATLAATSLSGLAMGSGSGRNLLDTSNKRMDHPAFSQKQLFGMDGGEVGGTSNIWNMRSDMGMPSEGPFVDASTIPSAVRVMPKSMSDTMDEKKMKRPPPSKLRNQMDSMEDSPVTESSRFFNTSPEAGKPPAAPPSQSEQLKNWSGVASALPVVGPQMNPLAPSFQPSGIPFTSQPSGPSYKKAVSGNQQPIGSRSPQHGRK